MALPDREGRFKGKPVGWELRGGDGDKLANFACDFELTHWWFDGNDEHAAGWYDMPAEITGYFYLEKRDGDLNEFQIKMLKEAFGWDGRDFGTLVNTDWSGVEMQLSIAYEEYKGKRSLKIQFLNPVDWEPSAGCQETKPETLQAISNKFGAKLRATAGPIDRGTPAPTSKPTPPEKAAVINEDDIPF